MPVAAGLVGREAGCLGVCQGDATLGASTPNPGALAPHHAGGRLPALLQASHSYEPELGPAPTFRLEENSFL